MRTSNLLTLFTIGIFCSCASIKTVAPVITDETVQPPPLTTSTINIPTKIDLGPYFKSAETGSPSKYEGSDNPCEGLRYYYQFLRSPFTITGNKDVINVFFDGKYKIKGSYCAKCFSETCLLPTPTFSCGFGEPLRKIEIGYSSKVKLLPNYHLSSVTTLTKANAVDKCKISFANIDITDRLMKEIKSQLENIAKDIDKEMAAYDLRPYVKDIWSQLYEVQKVEDFGFFSINPNAVSVSNINMIGATLHLSIGLSCTPVFSLSPISSQPTPLPNLSTPVKEEGFNVYTDLVLNYKDLTDLINKNIAGKTFKIKNKTVVINKVDINGIGNSKIALKLDFKGSKKGVVYLVGSPVFDSEKNLISMPDMQFDLKSKSVLLKMANWLLNDKITEKIKTASVFDITALLGESKNSISAQLNRKLTEDVTMQGAVSSLQVQNIFTLKNAMYLRVLSTGKLSVEVK